jgi:OOP family OmpA-OmpF porin
MRCNPLRWLWGLVLIAGLLGIMQLQGVPADIENDLQRRTQAGLAESGLGWASVSFSGRDAIVSGLAFEEGEPRKAIELTRSVWGVRTVENRSDLIEEQKNYVWLAQLRDNRVRLSGFVPNENTRRAIIGAAKATLPQLEIEDKMKLARGAPNTDLWLGAVSFSLKQLAELKNGGRVEVDRDGLGIEGEAQNFTSYRAIKSALANLPQGLKLKVDKVAPPPAKPFVWAARLHTNQLHVAGFVPAEAVREQIVATARRSEAGRDLFDRMQVATGEPRDFAAAALAAIEALSELEEGGVEIKDDQLTITGTVAKEETAEALRNALKSRLPASFRLADHIKFREPAIKPVSPYSTGVALEGNTAILTGFAPSDEARAALAATVQQSLPGRKVIDRLRLATGTPEAWKRCFDSGLAAIARLGNGRFALVDATLSVAGTTDDEDVAAAAREAAASGNPCASEFDIAVKLPPEPELNWRAILQGGELLIEGEVPHESVKAELVREAGRLLSSARLEDRSAVKPGPPKRWMKVSRTALEALAKLRSGEARITGQELLVRGEARELPALEAIAASLRDLPRGYRGREEIILRTDAMIAAEAEAKRAAEEEQRRAAEEQARREAEAEARRAAEEEKRRLAEEEARRRAAEEQSRRAAEEEKRRLAEEEAKRRAAEEEAKRRAAEDERRRAAEAETKRIAEEERRRAAEEEARQAQLAALTPERRAEVDRCQTLLSATAQEGVINFERASAELKEESLPTLAKLADAANSCPNLRIDIRGHADAEGTPERNQRLSERRAQAVIEYLTRHGVAMERLTAAGYGATRPVAPNDTPESRAKNRRIEFIVRPN